MEVLYRFTDEAEHPLIVALKEEALRNAKVYDAINNATTWGEFQHIVDEETWAELVQSWADDEEGPPAHDAAFDEEEIPGYSYNQCPRWLMQDALEWFPTDLVEKYDALHVSVHDGDFLGLPGDKTDEILEELRDRGFTVTESDLYFR